MQNLSSIYKFIHKDGLAIVLTMFLVTVVVWSFSVNFGLVFFFITSYIIFFFRNPDRITPEDDGILVSPCDGKICSIRVIKPPQELHISDEQMLCISVHIGMANVHVNRVPASGKILMLRYHPGKFFSPALDKSSHLNERQSVLMQTSANFNIAFVQIAGIITRRIVCDLEENQEVKIGDRFGIIRFGSRMDVYLPETMQSLVRIGQTVIGGETVLARI